MAEEQDLILGENEEQESEILVNSYDERADIRADIDSAIAAYSFLDEQDSSGADILRWGMKRKVLRAKRQCLQLICDSINLLQVEEDKEEEEE
jgi:hypothetical protein